MGDLSRKAAVRWGLAACLFLIVLGSHWAVVSRAGTDLPTKDQWDAEGAQVLVPWLGHRLTAGTFFQPQNEHRIVLTKLVNFSATAANGQWDQRVECAINAAFPALIAAAFLILICRRFPRRWHAPFFLFLAAVYCLPLGWENTLGGMHSAQIFLIGLSFAAIVGLAESQPGSRGWWFGAAAAILALGSLATGFFAAAVVIALLALRVRRGEVRLGFAMPALALGTAVVVIGCATRVTVDYHALLRAQGPGEFGETMLRQLDWPGSALWLALILWLPWGWLVRRILAGAGGRARTFGYTIAGLGGWVLLQVAATAYARGAGAPFPASRYVDSLLFGLVVNGLALAWLWEHGGPAPRGRLKLVGGIWALALALGLGAESHRVFATVLPDVKVNNFYGEQNTRNFLATGDRAYLRHPQIPYPDAAAYEERLGLPGLRSLLPASVRAPIVLVAASPDALVRYDSRAPEAKKRGAAAGILTGISPGTPLLDNRTSWGSYRGGGAAAPVRWESAPLAPPRARWLKFLVAGKIGEPGVVLELRDAATHDLLGEVRPRRVPGEVWNTVHVRAPRRPFVISASGGGDSGHWLAFSEPVEVGVLSYWASWGLKYGLDLAAAGTLAGAILLLRRPPETGAGEPRPDITFGATGTPVGWDATFARFYPSGHAARWLGAGACVLAAAAIWLITVEIPLPMIGVGLDESWQEVLVQAHLQGWQFGKDIIFTYGPWGFLISHYIPGGAMAAKLAWEIPGKLALAAGIVGLSAAIPRPRRWLFLLASPFFLEFFPDTAGLLFITLLVLLWIIRAGAPPWRTALAVVALAFLAEMKFTECLIVGVGLASAVAAAAAQGRRFRAAALAAGFVAAFLVLWLAAGQNPVHLYHFFRYSLSLAGGYAACLSFQETPAVFAAGAAVMLLNLAFAAQVWRARPASAEARASAVFLSAAWFLAWKHGFVRADDHVYGFFSLSLLLALALPGLVRAGGRWFFVNVPLCLIGMTLADPALLAAIGPIFRDHVSAEAGALLHPARTRADYAAEESGAASANQLPALRAAVGRGSIDLLTYEQGLLLHNGLDYRPRPIFQSYSVFTPALMAKNLGFYLSDRAPDFVLLRLEKTVDWHDPMQEDALVLAALPGRYAIASETPDGLLLKRRGPAVGAPTIRLQAISGASAVLGEEIALPAERGHAIWLRAEFPLSHLGQVRAALYKPPLLAMIVTEDGGAELRYRVAPPMAAEGMILQPTIETTADYAAFMRGRGRKWARSVRFEAEADQAEFWTGIKLEFFRLPDLPVAPAP